ncbi:PUA-like domain-containing protein [Limtongia smithiae]|uniref:PUA-like domain-containing protein n=1 Tax=Limtongia smithiae TaxID=1125753 RepID=UPI0034CF4654
MAPKRALRSAGTVAATGVEAVSSPAKRARPARKTKEPKKESKTESAAEPVDTTTTGGPAYWLFKAEPESRLVDGVDVKFSYYDLENDGSAHWDGVRNYEARNCMQRMKVGDLGFFYHSNCKVPGIVGILRVKKEAYVDFTAFDTKHPYYDAKSVEEKPKWFMVDVEPVRRLGRLVSLQEIKDLTASDGAKSPLADMALLRRSRLSVGPVRESEWNYLLELAAKPVPEEDHE